MVAFDGLRPNADRPKSVGDNLFTAASFRRNFVELVAAMDQGVDIMPATLNFSSVAIEALHLGHVQPEAVIECMKLRNPQSGQRVFAEQECFPALVNAVCCAVCAHLDRGKPVSSDVLKGLRHFVSNPHLSGVEGSVTSYHTFVRGLTHFYQVVQNEDEGVYTLLSPASLMGLLSMDLHHAAKVQPILIADVVEALGSVPISPRLLDDLDSLLVNTAHPSRTAMPPQVRAAAVRAIADRVSCPPAQFACDESVGIIDSRGVFELFALVAKECRHPEVVGAVLDRMLDVLRDEADCMRLSWDDIGRSSFLERKGRYPIGAELKNLVPVLEEVFADKDEQEFRLQQLGASILQGDRIDGALMLHSLGDLIGKVTPRSWAPILQRALHRLMP
jgi:hypothetical protein